MFLLHASKEDPVDTNLQIVSSISNIIMFLAVIPALWVSGRIIIRNPVSSDHSIMLFLWLILGGFFLIPMTDLLSYLRNLLSIIVSPDENMMEMPLFLGTTSWFWYSIISLVVAITIYAIAFIYGRKLLMEHGQPLIEGLSLNDVEQAFIVLGLAGLLSSMIHGIVGNFLWILNTDTGTARSMPLGPWGAILGWVLAFLILIVVILLMNQKLLKEEL